MQNKANVTALKNVGVSNPTTPWYADPAYALNSVMPTLIHDYNNSRFYNSTSGAGAFPFQAIRTTNATQFDDLGRLVWAPANMITNACSFSTPTWSSNQATVNIDATVSSPFGTVVRKLVTTAGQVTTGNDGVGGISLGSVAVVAGQSYHFCFYARPGETNFIKVRENTTTGARARIDLTNGTIVTESGVTNNAVTGIAVSTQDAGGGWRRIIVQRVPVGTTMAFSIKGGLDTGDGVTGSYITYSSLEPTGIDSPKPFSNALNTTGTAKYCERMDYDPQTLTLRGLLVEPQITNIMGLSSSNVPANWNANQTSFTAATSQWGFQVIRMAVSSLVASQFGYVTGNSLGATAGSVYAVSAFVKKDNHRYIQLTTSANYTPGAWVNYDFDTNTFTENGAGSIIAGTAHAQLLQDGWVRLQFSFTANATASGAGVIIGFINGLADPRLTNPCSTLGAAVFTFGHQVETNSLASSHIPTFGVSATRGADLTTITSLTGWHDPTKQTWLVRGITNLAGQNTRRLLDVNNNSSTIRVQLTRSSTSSTLVSNGEFTPTNTTPGSAFSELKMLGRFNGTNSKLTSNGVAVTTATPTVRPVAGFTQVDVGHINGYVPGNCPCFWVRELIYWPDDTASDAQLQAKTA